ncbi:bile acid:sodium symporter family protein [Cellulophaga sp. HaHa_2_95]|uniref:bile acid:sodium symporter family protein n=1 Tax=Cellulophaga sp. HaHa_2_95 TaxID=2745558 RepID=UPI001C4E9F7E|nr:bile acid:sodium symporter family protein [Cellulophaga sp. HaHa_2_95]QXP57661.1 bile acid:sodium symporter family protein [Cellulophaga sp. HaHa_2_95]
MLQNSIDSIPINFNEESLWILNLALALVMFGISLEISIGDFKELFKKPKVIFVGVLSQFILLPLVTFILVILIKPYPSIALGMFMVAACPGGNISNFITHVAKGNSALSVCLTAIATLLAIFMTPLNLELWGSFYTPTAQILKEVAIDPMAMVHLVFVLLGVPLFLGMWVNYWKPRLAKNIARVLKILSLLFFVALICIALYTNRMVLQDYIWYVFWIVVIHNLIAFISGFSLAKLVGLNMVSTRTITIETGIQNSDLGLLLIFTFFDGLGGMALLAAFWGIWHLVSGLILASFWSSREILTKEI